MTKKNDCLKLFLTYLQIEKNYSPYTTEHYHHDIEEFFQFMNEELITYLNEVQYSDARLYLTKLFDIQLSRKSVARKISSLRSFYTFLSREKLVTDNPFAIVSLPKIEKRLPNFFYEKEIQVLFDSIDVTTPIGMRNNAILEFLYGTGVRVSECTQVSLTDIDFYLSTVLVHGKGSKDRYVPFGSFASDALKTYIDNGRPQLMKKQDHSILFVNFRGEPLTPRGVRHILNELLKKASLIGKIHPHMIRHTFATHLLNNGADLRTVQELLGHAHLSSTQIYTHVTKDHLRKTYLAHHPRA